MSVYRGAYTHVYAHIRVVYTRGRACTREGREVRRLDEKSVERFLKRKVEEMIPGAKCLKFVSPGYTGVPDRIILLPGGAVVFAELKRPGEEPRQRQLFVQTQLARMGFTVAGCVDSPESVNKVVQMCMMISGQAQMRKMRSGGRATRDRGEGRSADADAR